MNRIDPASEGWSLLTEAGRDFRLANTTDLGFTVGPRINAAGRLSDITLGISCLLTGKEDEAHRLARELDAINRERRNIESSMHEQALASLEALPPDRWWMRTAGRRRNP